MEEFNTIEKVEKLFKTIDCLGNENNYFIAYKDLSPGNQFSGGMVDGMNYPYDAVLINKTENGIGMIFLDHDGIVLNFPKLEKLHLNNKNEHIFINNSDIANITIKKYALLNSSKKKIAIKTNDGKTYKLFSNVNESKLPYHNDGFDKFVKQYNV